MKQYFIKDIVNQIFEKKVIIFCKTKQECEEVVNFYRKHFNSGDCAFTDNHYSYPGDMCIELNQSHWSYCDSAYYSKKDKYIVISLKHVILSADKRIRGFEVVEKRKNEGVEITLPKRGTSESMAYDFFSPISAEVKPGEIVKIWTDVKAYMQSGEGLILNVRSSMGGKFMIANTQGWIEPDYYNNPSNEGNIGFFLKNISNEVLTINVGDRIGQGMFIPFLVSDNGNPEEEVTRTGGFGSTGK